MKIIITYIGALLACTPCIAETKILNPLWLEMQNAVVTRPDVNEVRRILDRGFDPNGSIGCGDSPAIVQTVDRRDIEMTKLLLEKGARVTDQAMLICCASRDLDLTLVRLLVDHGGNVNAKTEYGSCLHLAVLRHNHAVVQYIATRKSVDLDAVCTDGEYDGTPLMWALREGSTEIAKILLSTGANTKVKGNTGVTAASVVVDRLKAYEALRVAIDSRP